MSKRTDFVIDLKEKVQDCNFYHKVGEYCLEDAIEETEMVIRKLFGEQSRYIDKIVYIRDFEKSDEFKNLSYKRGGTEKNSFLEILAGAVNHLGNAGKLHTEQKSKLLDLLDLLIKELKFHDKGFF